MYLLPHTRTRAVQQYALLFEANITYGFRRNLWGMRWAGLGMTVLAFLAIVARLVAVARETHTLHLPSAVLAACSLLLLLWWAMRINTDWVKQSADAYAVQLLASCDLLACPLPHVQRKSA